MRKPADYGYAVVYDDPDCGGDYVGYFQTTLADAQGVVDEIRANTVGEHDDEQIDHSEYDESRGSCPMTIYRLIPVDAAVGEEEQ